MEIAELRAALAGLLLIVVEAQAQECVPASADMLVTADPGAAMIRPRECSTVEQNPPDFSWPFLGTGPYKLEVTFPDGDSKQHAAKYNWLNWNRSLPAGTYTWTVTRDGQTSLPRQFTVAAGAVPFVVPDMDNVIESLLAKPHPRGLPDAATLRAMATERAGAIARLQQEVVFEWSNLGSDAAGNGHFYSRLALKALMAYVYSGSAVDRDHAKLRVLTLASWDPRGPTAIDDQESLAVAWAVALGYDWLGPALNAEERSQVLAMLAMRIGDLYDWVRGVRGWPPLAAPPPLWQQPRDPHRNLVAGLLAAMSTLLAGDLPQAQAWLRELLPLSINMTSPWGGEEGGHANGTSYALWDSGLSLSAWYVLRWATCGAPKACVDLAQKAWVRNLGAFLAQFVPPTYAADAAVHAARAADPGTPIGLFGDGFAESQLFEQRARYAKGYARFAPGALACWYAASLAGEDSTSIEMLMAPPDPCGPAPALPAATPAARYLPSTGWVAMHSDLADLDRVSVYFKSSPRPFGAFNHQSADQNAFVVNAGGERLAIESGYYGEHDFGYNSDHWQYWVKRTKSKNAVTYDGGLGQIAYEHLPTPFLPGNLRYGLITQQQSAPDFEIVTGDATDAYNGALTRALRSLVFLRPGTILVYDNLASAVARRWEWNIHALDPFILLSDSRGRIVRGAQSLCIDVLASPPRQFAPVAPEGYGAWGTADDGVTSAAPADPAAPAQFHGKLAATQPSTEAEFIVLMRVNAACDDAAPVATKSDGVWRVSVRGRSVSFDSVRGVAAVD